MPDPEKKKSGWRETSDASSEKKKGKVQFKACCGKRPRLEKGKRRGSRRKDLLQERGGGKRGRTRRRPMPSFMRPKKEKDQHGEDGTYPDRRKRKGV